MNESIAQIISKVLSVIFGALIVVDLTLAIPQLIAVSKPEVDTADITDIVSDNTAAEETANIYYFVLDEAASFNTLEKYYNYDAAEFRNALEEYGFFISDDSYNEIYSAGSPRTVLILTNLFNLDYIAEYSWGAEQLSALRGDDCALKQLMTQHGYTFRGIGDTAWLGIPSETSNKTDVSGTTIDGVDLQQLIMGNTFLYPCFKVDYSKYKAEILASFEYFSGNTYGTESTFNFMYICSPHQPFIFDENGGEVPAAKQIDTSNDETYLGQYKFIMKKMLEVIECIVANDPDSVIVISSDHGTRFTPGIEYSEMSNILNAVYFRGEDISEIDGQSSVNTMRIILNRLFGDDLPLVEVPNE